MNTRAPVTEKEFGPNAKRPYDDDGAEAAGKGKRSKGKADKPKDGKASAEPAVKTRTHPIIVGVLTMLFAVLLVAAGLFMLYMDVGGIKAPFSEFFLDTPLAMDLQEAIFENRERVIEEREQAVTLAEAYNRTRQADLEARLAQLARDILEFERRQAEAEEEDWRRAGEIARLEDLLSGALTIQELAAQYGNRMDAEEAAARLAAMDHSLALAIFGQLSVARRTAIHEAMSVEDSNRFTESAYWQGMNTNQW
jgi:flagellar motility protein MotE (MotC chaperone)